MQALSHVDLQYNIPAQAGEPETLTGQSAELCSGSDFNFEKIDAAKAEPDLPKHPKKSRT